MAFKSSFLFFYLVYLVLLLKPITIKHYLMVEVFPVVLCHQAKQGQEGPPKGVEAGVAVVWVPPRLQAVKPIWTLSATRTHTEGFIQRDCLSECAAKTS